MRILIAIAAAATIVVSLAPAAVATPGHLATSRELNLEVEKQLDSLGLPVGKVDGKLDSYTTKALCSWRELSGRPVSRANLKATEVLDILDTTDLAVPKSLVTGLNVNRECQVVTWVKDGDAGRKVKGVFMVSTGAPGHTTPSGNYRINRQINSWHESTGYPGAMMYRPKYFNGGIAFHGSATDSLVKTYPASHGCVRMLHKDIDRLWSAGVGVGTPVRVYG